MTAIGHCKSNAADRKIGKQWERNFCNLAANYGRSFTPMQIGRDESAQAYLKKSGKWNQYTLPDITVWTHPGEHHEIKHKNPTRRGMFGLEAYRFNALLWFARETKQDVLYTIHDWDLAGSRNSELSFVEHWLTAKINDLNENWEYTTDKFPSYVNGVKKNNVAQHFWPTHLWMPLCEYWRVEPIDSNGRYTEVQGRLKLRADKYEPLYVRAGGGRR